MVNCFWSFTQIPHKQQATDHPGAGKRKKVVHLSPFSIACYSRDLRPAGRMRTLFLDTGRWQPPQLLCAHLVIAAVNESVRVTAIQRKLRRKASTCQLHCTGYPAMGREGMPHLRRGSAAFRTLLPTQHN